MNLAALITLTIFGILLAFSTLKESKQNPVLLKLVPYLVLVGVFSAATVLILLILRIYSRLGC